MNRCTHGGPGKIRLFALTGLISVSPWSGCSLVFVNGPPRDSPVIYESSCTRSYWWPAFDSVIFGFEAYRTMNAPEPLDPAYRFGIALGVLAVTSALVGINRIASCNETTPWPDPPHAPSTPPYNPKGSSFRTVDDSRSEARAIRPEPPATTPPAPAVPVAVPSPASSPGVVAPVPPPPVRPAVRVQQVEDDDLPPGTHVPRPQPQPPTIHRYDEGR